MAADSEMSLHRVLIKKHLFAEAALLPSRVHVHLSSVDSRGVNIPKLFMADIALKWLKGGVPLPEVLLHAFYSQELCRAHGAGNRAGFRERMELKITRSSKYQVAGFTFVAFGFDLADLQVDRFG